jgi:signal transduction histidine kinase
MGDRVRLQQVILNLIMNGIEAMSAVTRPRVLRVSSQADEHGDVTIAVTDTGTGLDPTQMERIFDAFFTTKPEGMGVGLSICRSIVEAHGGRLWASPNPSSRRNPPRPFWPSSTAALYHPFESLH